MAGILISYRSDSCLPFHPYKLFDSIRVATDCTPLIRTSQSQKVRCVQCSDWLWALKAIIYTAADESTKDLYYRITIDPLI